MYTVKRAQSEREKNGLWVLACVLTLLLLSLSARILFAKTYVITDGTKVFTYTAFAADPDDVLTGAGVELKELDFYTTGTSSITVCRARNITLLLHGKDQQVSSQANTVGELLAEREISLTDADVLSPKAETELQSGMTVRVDRVVTGSEVYTTTVAHETVRCTAEQIPAGEERVLIRGRDGELLRSAEVTYVNGEETRRTVLTEKMLTAPVAEIIGVGTMEVAPAEKPTGPIIGDGIITLPGGEILTYTRSDQVRATAYTHTDEGCNMITATGTTVHMGTVAVDPRYIPYGTRMFIMANDGSYVYGVCQAEDCGGAIKGDRVDLYYPSYDECMQFGRRTCTVYFLG